MPNYCVAFGCNNTSSKPGISCFRFPKNPILRKKWIQAVRKTRDKWPKGPSWNSVVCSEHFTQDSFDASSQLYQSFGMKRTLKLKNGAIPSIFNRPNAGRVEKKRTAYQKREHLRVLRSAQKTTPASAEPNDDALQQEQPPSSPFSHNDHDESEAMEVEEMYKSVKIQVNIRPKCHKNIQTTLKPKQISKGIQTDSLITCCDIGIQCNLLLPVVQDTYIGNGIYESSDEDEDGSESDAYCDDYEDEYTSDYEDEHTSDYKDMPVTDNIRSTSVNTNKYIVSEQSLLSLFSKCNMCQSGSPKITKQVKGTFVQITQKCVVCLSEFQWDSQQFIGDIPEANLLLSAAILFNGCQAEQSLRIFSTMGCASIKSTTFYNHQKIYLFPAIFKVWDYKQQSFFQQLSDDNTPLILGGDGRADSPGHSAKYGSYTMMELNHKTILDIQLVQSNEVKSSNHMEMEGFERAMKKLTENGLNINTIITDRHQQISKWVREKHPNIKHLYDVWHLAKSLKKKLKQLAKKKNCDIIQEWSKSIINHLYWCALSTPDGNEEMIKAKWLSLINYLHNKHSRHGGLYKKCAHKRIRRKRKWLTHSTEASVKVSDLISNTRFCNQVKKMSPRHQTSSLEAFHSVLIHFAPKSTAFSYKGMLARQRLATLHFNENSSRLQAETKSGKKRYSILFPKYKAGGHVVRPIQTSPTYGYVQELLEEVVGLTKGNIDSACHFDDSQNKPPPPLSVSFEQPDKSQAIAAHKSRFAK